MKKALLLLALSTMITLAAFADGHHKVHHSKPIEKNSYYLRADLGTSSALKLKGGNYDNDKVKRATVYSLGVGKYLSNKFRTDLSASIRNYKLKGNSTSSISQKIQSLAVMINGYYDIATFGRFIPYLSAGVGLANNKAGTLTINSSSGGSSYTTTLTKKSTNNLAWQVGAGSAIKLTNKIDLDLNYKFMDMGKVKTGSGSTTYSNNTTEPASAGNSKLRTHEFSIGARYNF